MTEYRKGQRVRVEWPNGSAVEGPVVMEPAGGPWVTYGARGRMACIEPSALKAAGATVTVLAEPRPEEPTGLGAVVEAGGIKHLNGGGFWIALHEIWIALHEDAREPQGAWITRRGWADLIDPVVLHEGWQP